MKVAIGCDHAGVSLKNEILPVLKELAVEWKDFGTTTEESVDYPDFGERVSEEVSKNNVERGILICGTGIGICMAANKVKGIRGAVCWNEETARLSRQHNDANVLCMGARFISIEDALKITRVFLETPASEDERHQRRVSKITSIEERSKSCGCR